MRLLKEPKHVDFSVESKPWTEIELADFRKLMQRLKKKYALHSKKSDHSKKKPQA